MEADLPAENKNNNKIDNQAAKYSKSKEKKTRVCKRGYKSKNSQKDHSQDENQF